MSRPRPAGAAPAPPAFPLPRPSLPPVAARLLAPEIAVPAAVGAAAALSWTLWIWLALAAS